MFLDKKNLFQEIKQFKKKSNQSKYQFKSKRKLKQINLDNTVNEGTNLIDFNNQPEFPPSLLFYNDLNNLKSSFNVSMNKLQNFMKKKLRNTWDNNEVLDKKINDVLKECHKHVKIFEQTLNLIQQDKADSLFSQMIDSIKKHFQLRLREMIRMLKNQEQNYFQKLRGIDKNSEMSTFDFINDDDQNIFDNDKVFYDDEGKMTIIKEIKEDGRQDLIKMLEKIDSLTQSLSKMSEMTLEQGAMIDRIDVHIEMALHRTQNANEQLFFAKEDMQKGCGAKLVKFLMIANIVLFILSLLRNYVQLINMLKLNKNSMNQITKIIARIMIFYGIFYFFIQVNYFI